MVLDGLVTNKQSIKNTKEDKENSMPTNATINMSTILKSLLTSRSILYCWLDVDGVEKQIWSKGKEVKRASNVN